MERLTIDMRTGCAAIVSVESLTVAVLGCRKTLNDLGPLAQMVEGFRISFRRFATSDDFGPCIKIFFQDPIGTVCSHETDYRFMGSDKPESLARRGNPSAEDITAHLMGYLPSLMLDHIKRGDSKLKKAQALFRQFAERVA